MSPYHTFGFLRVPTEACDPSRLKVGDFGSWDKELEVWVSGSGFWVQDSVFRVRGLGLRIEGSGWVEGCGFSPSSSSLLLSSLDVSDTGFDHARSVRTRADDAVPLV